MIKRGKGVALVEAKKLQIVPLNIAKSMKRARIIKTADHCKELWEWMKNTEYRKRLPPGQWAERFAGSEIRLSKKDMEQIKKYFAFIRPATISYRLKMRWKNFKGWLARKLRRG